VQQRSPLRRRSRRAVNLWNWGSRRRPDLEYRRPGSSVLGGSDVTGAEMKEVFDLIAGREKARPTLMWTAKLAPTGAAETIGKGPDATRGEIGLGGRSASKSPDCAWQFTQLCNSL
jgi:hypothetical protein